MQDYILSCVEVCFCELVTEKAQQLFWTLA